MITQKTISIMEELLQEHTAEELMEFLYVREQVDEALNSIGNVEEYTIEEIKELLLI